MRTAAGADVVGVGAGGRGAGVSEFVVPADAVDVMDAATLDAARDDALFVGRLMTVGSSAQAANANVAIDAIMRDDCFMMGRGKKCTIVIETYGRKHFVQHCIR